MTDSQVRQRLGGRQPADRLVFDLLAAKLLRPQVRPGTIQRPVLVERLVNADGFPVVSVVAPAGFGKTTLLSQWAERDERPFAWVSVDEADNDPKVLFSYVAEALDAVEPVGERVFEALASPVSSVPGSVVPRLGAAFSSITAPMVLVLDDVHLLHDSECRAALSVLAEHVPDGSHLVLAGRIEPPLRTARLRAEGKLLEVSVDDLSLTAKEAALLLRAAEVALDEAGVAELHRRTEGWPVGLYLAALYLRERGAHGGTEGSFGGDDRFVSEYLESEFLTRISADQRAFLTRTAVLQRMSGPLCEAVLEVPGAAATLAELARSNLLLMPLDRRGHWYRYHHLFRDMLLAELERLEPELIPGLRRRAAGWYLRNGLPGAALEYSIAAEDIITVAGLVQQLWLPAYRQGQGATVQRWLRWLEDRGGIEERPMLVAAAAVIFVNMGQPAEAERWADVIDRWQRGDPARPDDPAARAWAAGVRAWFCRHGVEKMRADADEAVGEAAKAGFAFPGAMMAQGIARVLCGDSAAGDAFLATAAASREADLAPETIMHSLAERSLLAIARGDWSQAEALADEAHDASRQFSTENAFVCAVRARVALHRGDVWAAKRALVGAQRLRATLTSALPYFAVQARIELAHVHLGLGDLSAARTLMREVDELLERRPLLGTLVGAAAALRDQLANERRSNFPGASALTAAELRLLPLLCTHLSFPEIATELSVSTHTVKSQGYSMYRKLGASSRSQAVARARELGLLEG